MKERSRLVLRCAARGFSFDVLGDAELHGTLSELFGPLRRRGGAAMAVYSIGREGRDATYWHVRRDREVVMGSGRLGEALHALIVHINQGVVSARSDLLSVHAAAVSTSDGAVLLPGASGSGKTTLCARLLQRGATYLSDDSVGLDHHLRVFGYPKPLGFKGGTWQQFAGPALEDLDLDRGRQDVWQIPPGRLGSSSVDAADPVAVVAPRFEPDAPLCVGRMSRHAAAAVVLGQIQNLQVFGVSAALEIIGQLVAQVACHTVVYGDAREAAQAVLGLIPPTGSGAAAFEVVKAKAPGEIVTEPFPTSDLIALWFEDGGLLVRGESGEFATVDGRGARIWPLLDGHRTIGDIGAELARHFGADRSEIEAGVSRWIDELVVGGFLIRPAHDA